MQQKQISKTLHEAQIDTWRTQCSTQGECPVSDITITLPRSGLNPTPSPQTQGNKK